MFIVFDIQHRACIRPTYVWQSLTKHCSQLQKRNWLIYVVTLQFVVILPIFALRQCFVNVPVGRESNISQHLSRISLSSITLSQQILLLLPSENVQLAWASTLITHKRQSQKEEKPSLLYCLCYFVNQQLQSIPTSGLTPTLLSLLHHFDVLEKKKERKLTRKTKSSSKLIFESLYYNVATNHTAPTD